MESTILLWLFGAIIAAVTVFVWLQLVRLALSGRWMGGPRGASADRHPSTPKDAPSR